MTSISLDTITQAIQSGEMIGFCKACGAEHSGIEPDAQNYTCEECGEDEVFGAEELLLTMTI